MTSVDTTTPRLTAEQVAAGQAFLRTLSVGDLGLMLDVLWPGVRIGDAGPASWVALNAIRSELEDRADGH